MFSGDGEQRLHQAVRVLSNGISNGTAPALLPQPLPSVLGTELANLHESLSKASLSQLPDELRTRDQS